MNRDYFQEALGMFNVGKGQWYGWKTHDSNGDKIPNADRMTYANIVVTKEGVSKPSEADVNSKIQELKDAETAATNKKASGKAKLKALGLDDEEIKNLGL